MTPSNFVDRKLCPVCASDKRAVVYNWPSAPKDYIKWIEDYYKTNINNDVPDSECLRYILLECLGCGLIYQQQIPNVEMMEILYNKWMDPIKNVEDHRKVDTLEYFTGYSHLIMRLIKYLSKLPGELRFLDYGMGRGIWAYMVKAFGCESWGLDLSEGKNKIAEQNGIYLVKDLVTKAGAFDFVNVDQVLEHVESPLQLLKTATGFIKQGGLIRVAVPDGSDIKKRLEIGDWQAPQWTDKSLIAVQPLAHINCFNRNVLLKLCKECGLQLIPWKELGLFPAIIPNNPFIAEAPWFSINKWRTYARKIRSVWFYNTKYCPTDILLKKL